MIAFGVAYRGETRSTIDIEGGQKFAAPQFNGAVDCRAQVCHLHVERSSRRRAGLNVTSRSRLGPPTPAETCMKGPSPISQLKSSA